MILNIKPYQMEYFEVDIGKNIQKNVLKTDKYMTSIELRRKKGINKNYLERKTVEIIYEYNIINNEMYKDYHANNVDIKINKNILINKMNFYNPIINNIFENFTKTKEIYNNKFLHEALYSVNEIKFNSNYKLCNKYQVKNIFDIYKSLKSYKNYSHFYGIGV